MKRLPWKWLWMPALWERSTLPVTSKADRASWLKSLRHRHLTICLATGPHRQTLCASLSDHQGCRWQCHMQAGRAWCLSFASIAPQTSAGPLGASVFGSLGASAAQTDFQKCWGTRELWVARSGAGVCVWSLWRMAGKLPGTLRADQAKHRDPLRDGAGQRCSSWRHFWPNCSWTGLQVRLPKMGRGGEGWSGSQSS